MLNSKQEAALDRMFGRDSQLEVSVNKAAMSNPDDVAESLNLPVSNDFYQNNKEEIKQRQTVEKINSLDLRTNSPKTSEWMSKEENAAVSIDDIETLMGVEFESKQLERTWGEFGSDTGIDLGKGVVGMGEFAVGVADLVTFNYAGNLLESAGYDPEQTRSILSEHYSKRRQQADLKVAEAKGFTNTLGALLDNPETAFGTIVESSLYSLTGVAAARAVAAKILSTAGVAAGTTEAAALLSTKASMSKMLLAGAASEGLITSGQVQEQARQAGRDWSESVLPAIAAGVGTAGISLLSSKFLPDVEVGLAKSTMGVGAKPKLLAAGKEIAKGTFKEGVLEELPQSTQEQIWTNLALGKPWNEGVGEAAAQGLVSGAGMGGGMATTTQAISLVKGQEKEIKQTIKSVYEQEHIDKITAYYQQSKTNGRSKKHFEDYINNLGSMYDGVLIPNEIATELEDAPAYITDQINELGASVTIPLDKFASEVAKNEEWMTIIRPHIKLSENSQSQSELESGDQGDLDLLLQKAQENKAALTEADKVFQTVKEQLVATGMQSDVTARYSAQLYPAAAAVMVEKAKKAGHELSVNEAFEMMGFQVTRGDVAEDAVGDVIFDQEMIPADLEIAMDSVNIDDGQVTQETFNAKELSTEIDSKLNAYQALRDCL